MPLKNSNDTIGNPTRDLPVCNVVPIQEHRYRNTTVNVTTVCVHLPAGQKFFSPQSRVAPELTSRYLKFFPGGAWRPRRAADATPPSLAEFKNA